MIAVRLAGTEAAVNLGLHRPSCWLHQQEHSSEDNIYFFFTNADLSERPWLPRSFAVSAKGQPAENTATPNLIEALQSLKFKVAVRFQSDAFALLAVDEEISVSVTPVGFDINYRVPRRRFAREDADVEFERQVFVVTREIITVLGFRRMREFRISSRQLLLCPDPERVFADKLLQPHVMYFREKRTQTARVTLGFNLDEYLLQATFSAHKSSVSLREPHISVLSEFIFRQVADSQIFGVLVAPEKYVAPNSDLVFSLLG